MHDVLRRLAANPAAEFRVSDVAPDHLESLRPALTFLPDPEPGDQVACRTAGGQGCMRVLDLIGGALLAVCTCEAAEVPVPVDPLAPTSFTVDPTRLSTLLAVVHGLDGTRSALTPRCHYLGQADVTGKRIGVVLGLFDDRDAVRELRALPRTISDAVDLVVCLSPAFQPTPEVALQLRALGVSVLPLDRLDVRKAIEQHLAMPSRTVPLVVLSPDEEREFTAARFRCRWPIVVTGETGKGGTNVVEIAGTTLTLGPVLFPLFMRLLTALFETENGFLPVNQPRRGKGLAGEGYYRFDRAYQTHGDFRAALGDRFRDLVEVGGEMIRLSTHRAYVQVDCEVLILHRDVRVQDLARRVAALSGSRKPFA